MKLVLAIVHSEDAGTVISALLERGHRATRFQSSGGLLRQANVTIVVGVEDDRVEDVLEVVRDTCRSRTEVVSPIAPALDPAEFLMPFPFEVEVGGATVFVLPVERFERL